jgi:hypothetical protein
LSGAEPAEQVAAESLGRKPQDRRFNFGAEPAKAGDSPYMNFDTQSPVSRAPNFIRFFSWGLRPRLYAYACFAG